MLRRTGTNQPLMVQVRPTKRSLKKVICQRVLLRPFPQLELTAVVVPHGPPANIGHGGKPVIEPPVDLLLVKEKVMDRIGHDDRWRAVYRRRINAKWLVWQAGILRVRLAVLAKNQQLWQWGVIVIPLNFLLCSGLGDAVGTRKQAIQIVKTMVFRIDDHHILNALQWSIVVVNA